MEVYESPIKNGLGFDIVKINWQGQTGELDVQKLSEKTLQYQLCRHSLGYLKVSNTRMC